MEITIKKPITYDAKYLQVEANVRYWEDADINRIIDTPGICFPSRHGNTWSPLIEVDTGKVLNWKQGETADLHFKICDDGIYKLLDSNNNEILTKDGYVPRIMCPKENGYGDYIIMDIDENGMIQNWKPYLDDFIEEDDD